VHDAAATAVAGRLLLFGGGQFEGSDRIVSVAPGAPHLIGTLPQPLSDLTAVTIGNTGYVVGGWNGSSTNPAVYAVQPGGGVSTVGRLPLGVRYPAVTALGGRVIVAGGEMTSGNPTRRAWSFDPATGQVTRLPDLPAATDHTAGATLNGRVYVLGGLRDGVFTRAILSWAPGETRWRASGELPQALADLGAAPVDGGIVVVGGREPAGRIASVGLLKPRP
jgi:N-acetylneuraminic acid mutarotase